MAQENREVLELLKSELSFVRDGAYGRSPHTPGRASQVFEDSPTCLNFGDSSRPAPCSACVLVQFVPRERREESAPCRFIPLGSQGETVDDYYRYGTQAEVEDALQAWLGQEIGRIEAELASQQIA
jgi:hypothetical protein